MAETAHQDFHRGEMDIKDQRDTFGGFLTVTVWAGALIVMYVAMFTVAFAIGAGWLGGLAALTVIGVAAGVIFKLNATWWATLVIQVLVLGIGGAIIPWIVSLAG